MGRMRRGRGRSAHPASFAGAISVACCEGREEEGGKGFGRSWGAGAVLRTQSGFPSAWTD